MNSRPGNIAADVPGTDVDFDTIAAVSTPSARDASDGAIGIIRVSGPGAFAIAGRIFRGKKPFEALKPFTVGYGYIYDALPGASDGCKRHGPDARAGRVAAGAGDAVDEVLILKMRAPRSYTREDVVEIHCHAGAEIQRRILRLALRAGARAAEPGEFTKRAFLNGRIDLPQAEAVMDLIRAKGEIGAAVAMRQLEGRLSGKLAAVREDMIGLTASLEAALDFPEHGLDERGAAEADGLLSGIEQSLKALADSFEYGRAAREGVYAVIAGRPNVGKSTLLNLLAGRERAIVTDTPGTTRDIIDEYIDLGGLSVRFADTAGIREARDAVERIGVERAVGALGQADLAILVFAADEAFGEGDARLLELSENKKRVFVINKTDLVSPGTVEMIRASIEGAVGSAPSSDMGTTGFRIVKASLLLGDGLEEIEGAVRALYAGKAAPGDGDAVVANARHFAAVERGLESVRAARRAFVAGLPYEMPLIDIREALDALGEITGETFTEDVIDRIFSEFCVGK